MKQTWNINAGCFDFSRAMIMADGIRHNFTLKRGVDMMEEQWDQVVYHLIKEALLEPHSFLIGPEGRKYLQVYVPSREEISLMIGQSDEVKITPANTNQSQKSQDQVQSDEVKITYKNFAGVCRLAVENHAGLALYSTKDQDAPNMTIRLGALLSYLQYGDVNGPAQLIDNMIKAIKIDPRNPR